MPAHPHCKRIIKEIKNNCIRHWAWARVSYSCVERHARTPLIDLGFSCAELSSQDLNIRLLLVQWLGKVRPFNKGCQELKRKKEKRPSRFLFFLFSYWLNIICSFRGLLCTGSIPFAGRITVFIFWTFRFLKSELHRKKSAFKKRTFRNSKFPFNLKTIILVKRKLSANSHLHLAKRPELH